jgi:hypothetical protein
MRERFQLIGIFLFDNLSKYPLQHMENIKEEDSPQKVNELLEAKYGFGLYQFAHCLADIIFHEFDLIESTHVPHEFELPAKHYDDLINKLNELKSKTLKSLYEIEEIIFGGLDALENGEIPEILKIKLEEIKENYKLEPYFKAIDESIENLMEYKEFFPIKGRGRPTRARNYVILTWSYIMKRPDKKTDWKGIEDLFNWFYWNLKGTEFAVRLLPKKDASEADKEIFFSDDFKREIIRLREKLKNNIHLRYKVNNYIKYYFQNPSEISLWLQIDFTEKIKAAYIVPHIGALGKKENIFEEIEEDDLIIFESPLIIFPNGKTLEYPFPYTENLTQAFMFKS